MNIKVLDWSLTQEVQTHGPGGLRRKKHGLDGIKQLQQTEQNRMPSDLKAHLFERDSH